MMRHRATRGHGINPTFVEALEPRRLLSAGQLDPSFGNGGKVTVDFHGAGVFANAVATIGNQTVIAGEEGTGQTSSNAVVVRLNFDGSLDTTFGADHSGIASFHFGDLESSFNAIAPGPNNTIYAAGTDAFFNGGFLIVRILPNGTLDPTFANHGSEVLGFGFGSDYSQVNSIAIQRDGKIVVAGVEQPTIGSSHFAVMRLNPNGSQDGSFNGDGTKTIDFPDGGDAAATAVTLDYSGTKASNPHFGSVLLCGEVNDSDVNVEHFAVIRIRPDGHLDGSFNGNGRVEGSSFQFTASEATGVVVQSTGNIVLSGTIGSYANGGGINNGQFFLERLLPNGRVDQTFGTDSPGVIFNVAGIDAGDCMILGPDDRLIVGGSAGRLTAVLSFTSNGVLDDNFGRGGVVTTDFSGGTTEAFGIAYMGDRIVVAGGGQFDTARYIDTVPNVVVGAFIATATPQSPVTFIVDQSQLLPYDTFVDFSIGGTAVEPTLFNVRFHFADYTLSGMNVPSFHLPGQPTPPPPFVDIPAGQTEVLVTLTPIKHTTPQPAKTAIFTPLQEPFYNLVTTQSLTINILDNNTIIAASADAFVRDGSNANTNFGSSTTLVVKNGPTGFNRLTYLKFNLSAITNINSVKLQMTGNLSGTQDPSVVTDVFAVPNTSWSESGITFNNAPPADARHRLPIASATITGTTPTTYTFNITAYVKAQKAAGHDTISLVLEDPFASTAAVIFNSRESGNGPTLVIS